MWLEKFIIRLWIEEDNRSSKKKKPVGNHYMESKIVEHNKNKRINSYSLSFPMWDSRILTTSISYSSEHIRSQFLIHFILFFQQSSTWMKIDKIQCKWWCRHRESGRKVTVSGEVAFGFELSFVKDYWIYILANQWTWCL